MNDEYRVEMDEWKEHQQEGEQTFRPSPKTLLLAPNYVKDVQVTFGDKYDMHGYAKPRPGCTRRKLTIVLEVDPQEADKMRATPGMDDQQFVAFLMPCIQTSIYKTITGRKPGNEVVIEEAAEAPMVNDHYVKFDKKFKDKFGPGAELY